MDVMSLVDIKDNSSHNSRQWSKIKLSFRYWKRNKFSTSPYSDSAIHGPELIVSLTSFKARINSVYFTIESLFEQELKANRIILWLSKEEFPDSTHLPNSIQRLQKRGLEVRIKEGNLKSYKKLIYALEEFPQALIITVDDDTFYPPYLLKGLMEAHRKLPNVIHCYRGKQITFSKEGELLPYAKWDGIKSGIEPSLSNFPTGVGGVLYPPGCLDKNVLNRDLFLELAPSADDIWFKAMSILSGTPCLRITEPIEFPKVAGSQGNSLHKINNQQGANDKQLKQVFDRFEINASTFRGK